MNFTFTALPVHRSAIILFFLVSMIFHSGTALGNHIRGGEVTFECLQSGTNMGKIVFTVKLYRACPSGFAGLPTTVSLNNPLYGTYGGPSTISCPRASLIDVSPDCDTGVTRTQCGMSLNNLASNFAYEEATFISSPIQINGVPASTGSPFEYTTCCRTTTKNTTSSSSYSYYLRAVMFPYVDPATGQPKSLGSNAGGSTCYDSSPQFVERINHYGYVGKIMHFTNKTIDPDCDSLNYKLWQPMSSSTSAIPWASGYSAISPLPSTTMNSANIPVSLNKDNGNGVYRTVGDSGIFTMSQKVESFRYGQKVAEIFREYDMVIFSASHDSYSQNNDIPSIQFKNNSAGTFSISYSDTFNVGDTVHINIRSIDNDLLIGTTPQSVSLELIPDPAVQNFFNPYGCKFSSCAYLDTTGTDWNGYEFKKPTNVTADFKWYLDCEVVNPCLNSFTANQGFVTYNFSVIARDNLCPEPLQRISDFTIVVRDTASKQASLALVETRNGDAKLTWRQHKGFGFTNYTAYRSLSNTLPFVPFDTITIQSDTATTFNISSWNGAPNYYRIVSEGANRCSEEYNTVRTIVLNVDDSIRHQTELFWNSMFHQGNPNITGLYRAEADTGNGWFQFALIPHTSLSPVYRLMDTITTCASKVHYRILAEDLSNDIRYISNTDSSNYPSIVYADSLAICDGDSLFLGGLYRSVSGSYHDTLQTFLGCDSVRLVNLTVNPSFDIYDTLGGCSGDSFLVFGVWQKQDAVYRRNFRTSERCDSTVNIRIDIDTADATVNTNGRKLVAKPNMDSYQWVECPSLTPVPGATSRDFTPSSNGNYAVIVTKGYCSETSECKEILTAGIEYMESGADLLVYPNPASDLLTFTCASCRSGASEIVLYNSRGAEVLRTASQASNFVLDVSELPNGLYFYQFSSASVNQYARVVISR